jgi:hypothetical protein
MPVFLGQPGAAEVYLVPIVGFSLVALYAGSRLNQSLHTHLGIIMGAFCLFTKKEGLLIFALIIFTWYLTGLRSRFSVGEIARHAAVLFIGLSPLLVWRFTLGSLVRNEYFFYEKPNIAKFVTDFALLGRIGEKGLKILLANNYWVVLFLLLPLVFSYIWFSRRSWRDQLIPMGIGLHIAAITCVYLFSNNPGGPINHMEVSYERLATTPVLAAVLYCAKSMIESQHIAAAN